MRLLNSLLNLSTLYSKGYIYVTIIDPARSDKISLIAQKYTHAYNGIYLLFCRCYSNSVSFIELLRIFASYMVKLVQNIVFRKRVIKFERLKIKNFYGNKTGFVRPGHICSKPMLHHYMTALLRVVYCIGTPQCH